LGLASSPEAGIAESPGTPFVSLVSGSQDWRTFGYNVPRQADECDFMARGFSLHAFTKAYWGTGTITTGVAAALPGTTVHALARPEAIERGRFRIAHPSGTVEV
jgi:2-methylaconitate cis-trans-isomerase PrpF